MLRCYSNDLDLRAQSSIKNSGEKSGKSPKRGIQKKNPSEAKRLQNKGFAPNGGEAGAAKNHEKHEGKNRQKRPKPGLKKKSRTKPNTCKIKGSAKNSTKHRGPKGERKKTKKTKIQNGLKVF